MAGIAAPATKVMYFFLVHTDKSKFVPVKGRLGGCRYINTRS